MRLMTPSSLSSPVRSMSSSLDSAEKSGRRGQSEVPFQEIRGGWRSCRARGSKGGRRTVHRLVNVAKLPAECPPEILVLARVVVFVLRRHGGCRSAAEWASMLAPPRACSNKTNRNRSSRTRGRLQPVRLPMANSKMKRCAQSAFHFSGPNRRRHYPARTRASTVPGRPQPLTPLACVSISPKTHVRCVPRPSPAPYTRVVIRVTEQTKTPLWSSSSSSSSRASDVDAS